MDVLKAIYTRRAVRNYTEEPIASDVLLPLLHAAVQAPSAVNQQPWLFAVYQGRHKLHEYSERAKAAFLSELAEDTAENIELREMLTDPHFNIFYNASTLLIVLTKPGSMNPNEDCCLAAQNLMLAAHASGIGTCPIGFARPWLNLPETKRELSIPNDLLPVFPMIIGFPDETPEAPPRNDPKIVAWETSQLEALGKATALAE